MSARNKATIGCSASDLAVFKTLRTKYGDGTAWLWLWFNANPHSHFTGIYLFFPVMAAKLLGLSDSEVVDCACDLVGEGLIKWDRECDVIYIPTAMEVGSANLNIPRKGAKKENSNRIHASRHINALPSCDLVDAFCNKYQLTPSEREAQVKDQVPCESMASDPPCDPPSEDILKEVSR